MNVRDEFEMYAAPDDVPVLLWLFGHYSRASQWALVANCTHERYGKMSYETRRVWRPTAEGRALFAQLSWCGPI